jgi:hypothetical protein
MYMYVCMYVCIIRLYIGGGAGGGLVTLHSKYTRALTLRSKYTTALALHSTYTRALALHSKARALTFEKSGRAVLCPQLRTACCRYWFYFLFFWSF